MSQLWIISVNSLMAKTERFVCSQVNLLSAAVCSLFVSVRPRPHVHRYFLLKQGFFEKDFRKNLCPCDTLVKHISTGDSRSLGKHMLL